MLRIENGAAVIPGFGTLPLPDSSLEDQFMRSAKTTNPSPLGTMASAAFGLPASVDAQMAELFARDTVAERASLAPSYELWLGELVNNVAPAVRKCADVLKNQDLKEQVRDQRAMETLKPAVEALPAVFEKGLAPLENRVETLSRAVEMALMPEPVEGAALMVREQRAAEVRARALGLKELERVPFALGLASRGRVEAVHALGDDPAALEVIRPEDMLRVRETLLDALGGTALRTMWQDSIGHLEQAAAYADAIGIILANNLPFHNIAVRLSD